MNGPFKGASWGYILSKDHYNNGMDNKEKEDRRVGRCFEIKKADGPEEKDIVIHYYIEILEDKTIALELVDDKGNPTGEIVEQDLSTDDFNKQYTSCSHHDCPLAPKTIDEIKKKMADNRVAMGEKHLKNGELGKAEDKFNRALVFEAGNLKAEFGIGKIRMEQNKRAEAEKIFKQISEANEIYDMANKHTFNEFGIYLRKQEMYEIAIQSYEKAITMDEKDVALYFNLGKAYAMKGEFQPGIEKLKEALAIQPDFPEAAEHLKKYLKDEEAMLKKLLRKTEIDDEPGREEK
ncbi:hypothetical protein MNBD_NITROSPINAE04-519 [hydrothermal vent metagenome]|uniref:Uncharacterized protein n=1 Tax=hydrothermal vent metagenome TaxID=652676 RepID=A0A3B1C181_9ZZZZ